MFHPSVNSSLWCLSERLPTDLRFTLGSYKRAYAYSREHFITSAMPIFWLEYNESCWETWYGSLRENTKKIEFLISLLIWRSGNFKKFVGVMSLKLWQFTFVCEFSTGKATLETYVFRICLVASSRKCFYPFARNRMVTHYQRDRTPHLSTTQMKYRLEF